MENFRTFYEEREMPSAKVIITDGTSLLACHASNLDKYDLPGGKPDKDESPKQTAVRETKEETGLTIKKENLQYAGLLPYKSYKDLHIFILKVDTLPKISTLSCMSTYKENGTEKKEFTGYAHFPLKNLNKFETPMIKTIKTALNNVKFL